jgi:hypothetical protein
VQIEQLWRKIEPDPGPSLHPVWRKSYLWIISLAGAGISIAVLAAALAPSPGNHVQPIGGVLGSAGLLFSMWIGWYAHRVPLGHPTIEDAKTRIRARERSLRMVERNPKLASELGIGRPDLPRRFDDGGLVDVNHVPTPVLASLPGIDVTLAEQIVTMREHLGSFDSAADVEIVLNLPPTRLDQARELMIFRQP